jgi:hypothetical protein
MVCRRSWHWRARPTRHCCSRFCLPAGVAGNVDASADSVDQFGKRPAISMAPIWRHVYSTLSKATKKTAYCTKQMNVRANQVILGVGFFGSVGSGNDESCSMPPPRSVAGARVCAEVGPLDSVLPAVDADVQEARVETQFDIDERIGIAQVLGAAPTTIGIAARIENFADDRLIPILEANAVIAHRSALSVEK